MYGYPTQTVQETVDSLEMVRQLFELGILQSGFWHQFALTAHSPVGINPNKYHITPHYNDITFANNDVSFTDHTGIDHSKFSFGLKKSLFNYMHGIAFDMHLQDWFDFAIPETTIDPYFIESCLNNSVNFTVKPTAKIIWLGNTPTTVTKTKSKKGTIKKSLQMTFHDRTEAFQISVALPQGNWLASTLAKLTPYNDRQFSFTELKTDYETHFDNFELFWFSKAVTKLKENGLLVL